MLRVLFVDHETRLSGGERDLVDLIAGFPDNAVDAHVALPGEGPLADAVREIGAQVHVVELGGGLQRVSRWELGRNPFVAARHASAAIAGAARLARLTRRLRPDVIHSNSMKAHLLSTVAARATGAVHVWHVRDILEKGWLRTAFNGVARVEAARVLCLSHAAARAFDGSAVERRVRVVYNGIRPRLVTADARADTRRRLGATDGEVLIGMVGQIARWKGQDVFVEAARLIAAEHPDVRFAVVGECLFPDNEGDFERSVHARATDAGLDDRLVWAGEIDPIDPVMAALDLLVHASRLPEPFGRVIVEAMAQGTPVVTTTLGAGPELVPRTAGRVVKPDDPAALAGALAELLAASTGLAEMGGAARAHAARFTAANTAAGVLDVYREVGLTP